MAADRTGTEPFEPEPLEIAVNRTLDLPKVTPPSLETTHGMTMSSMLATLKEWEALGKLPFTQAQFAQQFPESAPLKEVFAILLGKEISRWEDASLSPELLADQVVPCQLAETLAKQLNTVTQQIEDCEDLTNYKKAAQNLADFSKQLYCPY